MEIKNDKRGNTGVTFFTKSEIAFGNSIRDIKMIQDISTKICNYCKMEINRKIDKSVTNSFTSNFGFSVCRDRVFCFSGTRYVVELVQHTSEDQTYAYYGYAAVDNSEKMNGIVWVLTDIVCRYLSSSIPCVSSITTLVEYACVTNVVYNAGDNNPVTVSLSVDICTNKFKEL